MLGEVPRLDVDPPKCLMANAFDALACATHPSAAASADDQQAVLEAAKQSGAAYLNVTPWPCTADMCPAIVGVNIAYRDRTHLTTTFTMTLVPVLKEALNIRHA